MLNKILIKILHILVFKKNKDRLIKSILNISILLFILSRMLLICNQEENMLKLTNSLTALLFLGFMATPAPLLAADGEEDLSSPIMESSEVQMVEEETTHDSVEPVETMEEVEVEAYS